METKLNEAKDEEDNGATDRTAAAVTAFALMEKLESTRPLPAPSVSKVFRLYCIEALSAEKVARQCGCSKASVMRRLRLIRKKTGVSPRLLRRPGSRLRTLHEIVPGFEAARPDRDNLFYGSGRDPE